MLVGGSTRIPKLQMMLREAFGAPSSLSPSLVCLSAARSLYLDADWFHHFLCRWQGALPLAESRRSRRLRSRCSGFRFPSAWDWFLFSFTFLFPLTCSIIWQAPFLTASEAKPLRICCSRTLRHSVLELRPLVWTNEFMGDRLWRAN